MWPTVFGPGWGWGVLVALVILCFLLGGLGLMFFILRGPRETAEPFDRIWHRVEEGDLTRREFERLRHEGHSS